MFCYPFFVGEDLQPEWPQPSYCIKCDGRPSPEMETEIDGLGNATECGQGKSLDDSCVCSWSRDQSDQLRQEAGEFQKGGLQGEKWNWFCINAFELLKSNTVGTWWS